MKSKTPKLRKTAEEIAAENKAVADYQRWKTAYRPLEEQKVQDLDKFGFREGKALAAGRSAADIAQMEDTMMQSGNAGLRARGIDAGSDAGFATMLDTAETGQDARMASVAGSALEAQEGVDNRRMSVINTGRAKDTMVNSGLRDLGEMGRSMALTKVNAKNMQRQAVYDAVGKIGGFVAGGGVGSLRSPATPIPTSGMIPTPNAVPNSPLSPNMAPAQKASYTMKGIVNNALPSWKRS